MDQNLPTLVDVVKKIGHRHYAIGRPIYFASGGGDEQEDVRVHAAPVLKMDMPKTLEILKRRKVRGNDKGIAIAYGGFIGIDAALAHDTGGVLLLDINPEQKNFWHGVIDLLKECPTAAEFNKRLSIVSSRYTLREPEMDTPEQYPSFTKNEELYTKAREWAQTGMMAATDMDVLDTNRHHDLAYALGKHKVSLVFLTNIPYFYNTSPDAAPPHGGQKLTFYTAPVEEGEYHMIFKNQGILADRNTKVAYADSHRGRADFPLKVKFLSEMAPVQRTAPTTETPNTRHTGTPASLSRT
ncbi:MAG: hypothetical protein K2Q01_04415 [Rickettsiales bacterium]|nr:hypothetical protein [Rickettsiales bacterium]